MNLTTKDYVFDQITKNGFTYYAIYDHKGNITRNQTNDNFRPQDAIEDLTSFFNNNSGLFKLVFRNGKTIPRAGSGAYLYTFYVQNNGQMVQGIGSNGQPQIADSYGMLGMVRELQARTEQQSKENFAQMIAGIEKQNELQIQLLKEQMKNKGGNDDTVLLQTITTALGSIFGGGSMAMTGFNDAPPADQKISVDQDTKVRINRAITRLLAVDPNFANHIEKLADMAESNKPMYDTALQILNSNG